MKRVARFYLVVAAAASLTAQPHPNRAVYAPPPHYPDDAKREHLTGSGVFELRIRPDGSVERVETIKTIGHASLDHAAVSAFQQWRFYPHSITTIRIPIRYIDGPPRRDAEMSRPPAPGYGVLISVFSQHK